MEITLLKTFIKESYNNLMTLRRAERSTEAEVRNQAMPGGGSHSVIHGDAGTYSTGVPNAFEPSITRSESPTSHISKSDNEESDFDAWADDDDINGISSTKPTDQNDHDGPGLKRDNSNAEDVISELPSKPSLSHLNSSDPDVHRESNLLLQMVPYRPGGPDPICSDRLLSDGQDPDSGTKSVTEKATNSVRFLLDKWTISGSAPVSNILDEEAAREKDEASVGGPSLVSSLLTLFLQ